jgi:hypothetical protein
VAEDTPADAAVMTAHEERERFLAVVAHRAAVWATQDTSPLLRAESKIRLAGQERKQRTRWATHLSSLTQKLVSSASPGPWNHPLKRSNRSDIRLGWLGYTISQAPCGRPRVDPRLCDMGSCLPPLVCNRVDTSTSPHFVENEPHVTRLWVGRWERGPVRG